MLVVKTLNVLLGVCPFWAAVAAQHGSSVEMDSVYVHI